jgi:heat shock protein HslJ
MDFTRFDDRRSRPRHRLVTLAAAALVLLPAAIAGAQEFPYERELLLDVDPMPGSKRVPSIDIAANGGVAIDMWCNSVQGQLVVAGDTITVLTGPVTTRECPPERAQGDEDMLAALAQVSTWRWEGEHILILNGARPLRFRVQTN